MRVYEQDGPGPAGSAARGLRLLIADHAPTRTGVRMVLGDTVAGCAEAGDVRAAIRIAKLVQPDVALIGRDLPGDWRIAVQGVCRAASGCAVIVLANAGDSEDMLESIRAGAAGFVSGPLDADRLRRVFAAVARREAIVPRGMVADLLDELRVTQATADGLTSREAQVLGLLRRGHSTAGIAQRLQIAPVTVRRHISELVRKLGVAGRADLVDRARVPDAVR